MRLNGKFTDEQISKGVKRALENDPWVNADEIAVRVFNKKAYLSGSVDSRFERNRAAEVTARVHGIAAIQNNINPPMFGRPNLIGKSSEIFKINYAGAHRSMIRPWRSPSMTA